MILTVDPGTKVLAYALWDNSGLYRAGAARSTLKTLANRTSNMISMMRKAIDNHNIAEIVVELPVFYLRSNKVDPNDLIALAVVAGAVLAYDEHAHHRLITPAEWKGQRPKDVTERRMMRELTYSETLTLASGLRGLPAGLHHNVYDAVGIGLWYLKRL